MLPSALSSVNYGKPSANIVEADFAVRVALAEVELELEPGANQMPIAGHRREASQNRSTRSRLTAYIAEVSHYHA